MAKTEFIDIAKLQLDLRNPRTTPQLDEISAIKTMISIKSDRFFGLMDSILEDGYLVTENIIVLYDEEQKYVVKEGNRRVAILKIIHGIYDLSEFDLIPNNIKERITNLPKEWLENNRVIPCTVFTIDETAQVERIINLTHAKGEKASRDPWTSVARARHNRDEKEGAEPALDLLEKYITQGRNINASQKERWSGDYPLSVLDEAVRKIANRVWKEPFSAVVNLYPKIKYRSELESLILDIGLVSIGFKEIRDKHIDFAIGYCFPPEEIEDNTGGSGQDSSGGSGNKSSEDSPPPKGDSGSNPGGTPPKGGTSPDSTPPNDKSSSGGTTSLPPKSDKLGTAKSVAGKLKKFTPRGNGREKVVELRDEMRCLIKTIDKTPLAFCFTLRSIFEVSAKAYANDNVISTTRIKNGKVYDKALSELLTDITNHLTGNGTNKDMEKVLLGAIQEIKNPDRLLSITSMNQIVHSTTFSVLSSDICKIFDRIYPLLEAIN